jgi:ATP-dependent exoDNAse (exonuclease V) alpha subunit
MGLTANQSSFTRREVVRTLAERSGVLGASALGELADRFLASEGVLLLSPKQDSPDARYSTPELIATERELLAGARERRGEGAGLVRESVIDSVLAGRPELSAEQAAMVRSLASSGDGLQVVLGRAGSGKTCALEPARLAWEAEGYQVIGAALAARAAAALEDDSGIRSGTLARLLTDARHPERSPLHAMSVVVLDEAGMAGTRDLAELARHAEEAGAKLVLVGDPAQLPEIAAGGAFRALAHELGALALRENRRQEVGWERQALLDIREGRAQEAVDSYLAHGRIHVGDDLDAAKDRLVADWWQATAEGADSLMIAATRSDAEDLARRARARRAAAGEIGVQSMQLPCREVAVGDRVMALRNDRLLGVQNGMRGVVVGLQGRGLEVAVDGERRVVLPGWYLADGHLTYADAITAHKAQGLTVDRAFVLASGQVSREWGYAALSRARGETRLYLGPGGGRAVEAEELGSRHLWPVGDAHRDLGEALSRRTGKSLAVEREPPGIELEL